jgi:DUF1680 family protein
MLKLARHVRGWTGDPACSEFIERAMWNGILGTQHPADGSKLYYVPLASGYWKLFGTPLHDFWCCTGTGSESFAKLGESVYFRAGDALLVDQFVSSELDWKEKGLRVVQETQFPGGSSTSFTFRAPRPVRAEIRLRVPSWTEKGAGVRLNGRALEGFAAPGGSFVLDRVWSDGDRVELRLPMALRIEPTPDDPSIAAAMFGPIVLAGRLGTEGLTPATLRAEPTKPRTVPEYKLDAVPAPELSLGPGDPAASIHSAGKPLEFRTEGFSAGKVREIRLSPLASIFDERYAVYWKIRSA